MATYKELVEAMARSIVIDWDKIDAETRAAEDQEAVEEINDEKLPEGHRDACAGCSLCEE